MAGARSWASPRSSRLARAAGASRATHGKDASIVAGVSRTPGRISRANARVGGNARLSEASAALAFSSVGASRRIEARRLASSLANAAIVVLKFVIRSLSRPSLRISAPVVRAVPFSSRATSRSGSVPSSASLTCGAAAQRPRRVLVGVVERLGGGLAARRRVGVAVVGRARLGVEPLGEPVEQVAQVLARVALQRGQHLVELDRRGGPRDLDRVAVVELRRRRRAGPQVDEEVALEEDARADLGRRVLVDRQPGVLDLHRHERLVGALLGLDRLDLADVDAGDPHGRVDAQRVGGLEDGVDAEAVRERDVLGEAEERRRRARSRARSARP